jgi:hypothetical protein
MLVITLLPVHVCARSARREYDVDRLRRALIIPDNGRIFQRNASGLGVVQRNSGGKVAVLKYSHRSRSTSRPRKCAMQHESLSADRRDRINIQPMALRSFLVDIALYAVVMILLSIYAASVAPLALAVVLIAVAALQTTKAPRTLIDDQPSV